MDNAKLLADADQWIDPEQEEEDDDDYSTNRRRNRRRESHIFDELSPLHAQGRLQWDDDEKGGSDDENSPVRSGYPGGKDLSV